MTQLKLMCFHPGDDEEEEALIEMELAEIPKDLPFIELTFVCPKCKKNIVLTWVDQTLGGTQ